MSRNIRVQTRNKTEIVNVTEALATLASGIQEGLGFFYSPHTTVALFLCEDDDELRADLVKTAEQGLSGLRPFQHIRNNNPNAEAHIFSAMAGTTVTLAIRDGQLDLGKYQNILLLEMDGPKEREIRCQVIQK